MDKKALERFNEQHSEHALKALDKLTLKSIEAIKLYNCFHGKKIWNHSELQKYDNNCLYTSFDAAAEFAETIRARGRTIYIKEMPAILLKNDDYCIAITQFNEHCPLTSYSATATQENEPEGTVKIDECGNNYLTAGAPMKGVLLSFRHNSRFWKKEPTEEHSIITLHANNTTDFEALKTTKLKAWCSKSAGKDNPLDWYEEESNISQSAILRHYKQTGFQEKKGHKFKPLKIRTATNKKTNLETLFKAIKNQPQNDLFFFYRENDLSGCLGESNEFWIEPNNNRYSTDSAYLLYAKSPKKGIEIFQVLPETCELSYLPDLSQPELAA